VDKKFTEPGALAPVLPHRALFVLCLFFPPTLYFQNGKLICSVWQLNRYGVSFFCAEEPLRHRMGCVKIKWVRHNERGALALRRGYEACWTSIGGLTPPARFLTCPLACAMLKIPANFLHTPADRLRNKAIVFPKHFGTMTFHYLRSPSNNAV